MPRRPNTRPTAIYWLIDTRPETLLIYPNGKPFYCGKTIASLSRRLSTHKREATNGAMRPLHQVLRACGDYVRIQFMERVNGANWSARERHWICLLRASFGGANVSSGGQGAPGLIHSEQTRKRLSEAGRNLSAEARAKISAAHRGRKQSPEWIAKRAAGRRGKKHSDETRRKMSAARRCRSSASAETREKIGSAFRGKKQSLELISARAAANRGKKRSPEIRERMSRSARIRVLRTPRHTISGRFVGAQ